MRKSFDAMIISLTDKEILFEVEGILFSKRYDLYFLRIHISIAYLLFSRINCLFMNAKENKLTDVYGKKVSSNINETQKKERYNNRSVSYYRVNISVRTLFLILSALFCRRLKIQNPNHTRALTLSMCWKKHWFCAKMHRITCRQFSYWTILSWLNKTSVEKRKH